MELPNLDFLGDNKVPVVAGGLVLVGVLALGKMMQPKQEMGEQKVATLIPAEGATWSEIFKRREGGTLGYVGPADQVPVPGPPGPAGTPGTDTTVVVNADWLKTTFNGQSGYVHASYVSGGKVNTPGSCLRFRAAADYNARIITCIPHGTPLTVSAIAPGTTSGTAPSTPSPNGEQPTGNTPVNNTVKDGYTWILVSYGGKSGYVASSYLSGNTVTNTGTAGLRMRSAPGLSAPVVGNIPNGSTVIRSGSGVSGQAGEAFTNPGGTVKGFFAVPAPLARGNSITAKPGDTVASLANRGYGANGWARLLTTRNPGKGVPVVGETWRL